ncbi:MAG: hypothetical protein PHR35_14565 [Kiritimatiellae bacterium]|nr:hypothetical protein [Kiritimatiellia bacterium]
MTKRLMILGAGSSGRGQLGQVAHAAGWQLVLVDRDRALVEKLCRAGRYTVRLCRADGESAYNVDGFSAYGVDETDALVREGLSVPLILTCLLSPNLPAVAPLVARIVAARHARGVSEPLNVICCENMQHGSTTLRGLVMPLLPPDAAAYAEARVGFPDCMISRVVPLPDGDPLTLLAEDYNEWTVDRTAFKGPAPDLAGMELVDNQEARLARKFFMHNGAHAVCGYWGFHRGHNFIHEAVADPVVLGHVVGAINELAQVVGRHFGFGHEATRAYGLELGPRGAIAALRDGIPRVVRDPLRKLSHEERLVAPAVMAIEDGTPCRELVLAMAAALRYSRPDDPSSIVMRDRLSAEGARAAIPAILGLSAEHPLVAQVLRAYEEWQA